MPLFPRKSKAVPAGPVKIESAVFGAGASSSASEARTFELGRQILDRARSHKAPIFKRRPASTRCTVTRRPGRVPRS